MRAALFPAAKQALVMELYENIYKERQTAAMNEGEERTWQKNA